MPVLTNRGVRLTFCKQPAADRPIEDLTDISRVYLPVSSANGKARCVLQSFASVLYGQVIARPDGARGIPALSTVSGVFTEHRDIDYPGVGMLSCIVLDCMDARRPAPSGRTDTDSLTAEQIVEIARQQAVIDELDGRPLYEKLRLWAEEGCDVVVGDAVEDQPYASAAWEVLSESVEQVWEGLSLAARAVGCEQMHLAVQPLPKNHYRALCQRLGDAKKLFTVRRKYPAVARTEKPFGKRVRRIGVQALLALLRAAAFHEPHTACVVTVAGDAVATPRNVRVPFGTPASDLFRLCGLAAEPTLVLFGDVMTGHAVENTDLPILPGVTCLLALTAPLNPPAEVCVGCGRCAQVCHAGLMPVTLMQTIDRGQTERLHMLHAEACDGCGACAAVCPAGLELSARICAAGREADISGKGDGDRE